MVKGAVEAERKFLCEALPCNLREPIVADEGVIYGMVQNEVPDHLGHSIVKSAAEAARQVSCEALPCDLREPIVRDEGLHTEIACVIYGMVQNEVPEHLVHSIVKGAVEAVRQFICEALPCNLREPIVTHEGVIYGMVQNEVPEHSVHSIVKGAVEAVRQFICEALPCNFREPIVTDEGVVQDETVVFVMAARAALLQLLAVLGVPLV